jgi:hypothetical protein
MSNMKIKMAKVKSEQRPIFKVVDEKPIFMPNPHVAAPVTNLTLEIPKESGESIKIPLEYNEETQKITPPVEEIKEIVKEVEQNTEVPQPEIVNQVVYSPTQTMIDTINEMTTKKEIREWIEGMELASEFDLRMNLESLKDKVIQYLIDQNTIKESEQ